MAVTTMNPIYTSTEISRQLTMSRASWVFTNIELLPVIHESIAKLQNLKVDWKGRIIVVEETKAEKALSKLSGLSHLETFVILRHGLLH